MNKIYFLILVSILMISLSSAVGTSTKYSDTKKFTGTPNTSVEKSTLSAQNCDSFTQRQSRVKCRLDNLEIKSSGLIDEACKTSKNFEECQSLYAKVSPCYDKSGKEKDSCFKKIAGLEMKSIKSQKDEEGKRKYLLFLLYDLQERVEKQYEEGKISSQDASGMINTILTAKEAVNEGKDKNQIRSTLVELKELWKAKIK